MDFNPPNFDTEERMVAELETVIFKPSAIHGTGGFARAEIEAGTRVIEYVGERITKQQSLTRCEQNNAYIFALDTEHDLDGNVDWNPARFLNHSCEPNCEAVLEDGRIWVVGIRKIAVGEELTFNYGYDFEDYREHPCCCGVSGCIGYIVAGEFFDELRRRAGAQESAFRKNTDVKFIDES